MESERTIRVLFNYQKHGGLAFLDALKKIWVLTEPRRYVW